MTPKVSKASSELLSTGDEGPTPKADTEGVTSMKLIGKSTGRKVG